MAKSRLHIAYCMAKALSIDHCNYSENLCLKITQSCVVKSRISVNISGSSRITQNLQVTKLTFSAKRDSLALQQIYENQRLSEQLMDE